AKPQAPQQNSQSTTNKQNNANDK
ncbi:TPA: DUF4887 domain-containing protein, partial [Staphylococcus aureus]|nr:DUF4887 domain-containing protein [Staphylococcus aureus]HDK8010352.1 DUF4887 domain-containing protein [Staphylococcus aureus]HDK8018350.1 DUF4887 domain-containing protein [Staphylococcus aureus]